MKEIFINSCLIKKITALCLVAMMLLSAFPFVGVASNVTPGYSYDENGTVISNEYLRFAFNGGDRFSLHTTGGDPDKSSDDSVRLLYGDYSGGTSDTILRINGTDYVFYSNNCKVSTDGESLYATMVVGDVLVEQYITLSYNTATQRKDTVEFKYVITNTGTSNATAGGRIFFDTMLGNNDAAPFRVPGVGDVTSETEFVGDDIPQTWYAFQSLSNESVVSCGKFYNEISERPDKVQFIYYGHGYDNRFDCYIGSESFGDSAVNVYYNPIDLVPGESRTFSTYYGLSEFVPLPDPDPFVELNMQAIVDRELLVNTTTNTYFGNPFGFSAWIYNTGNTTANNISAKIILPEGLSLIDQSDTKTIPSIVAGGSQDIFWSITADNFYEEVTLPYYVQLFDDGELVSTYEHAIVIHALERPHVHTESNWIEDVPAGCTSLGTKHTECIDCGQTISVGSIPAIGHSYIVETQVDATCTTDGYVIMRCTGCNDEKRNIIYSPGHDFGNDNVCDICGFVAATHTHNYSVVTVPPTCTEMGYSVYTCSCGISYRADLIDQTGHHWNGGEITVLATCTTDGVITYTCCECSVQYIEVLPASHDWSEQISIEATCWEDGLISRVCNQCGKIEEEIIPAGHKWNEGTIIDPSTCTEAGRKLCTCTVCGVSEIILIDKLGHEFYNGVCRRCGARIPDVVTPDENHPEYGMYFEIDDIVSNYGPDLINEYGLLLDYNQGATLKKVAVYLTQEGNMWRRCIAVVGEGITYATYVPYLSYGEDIKYTGLNSAWINTFSLRPNADGIWCYSNYTTIGVNLEDRNGNLLLSLYDIGQAGAKTRIFDNLEEMIAWLKEDSECITHTESDWIIDREKTCVVDGYKYKVCTVCDIIVDEMIDPAPGHTPSDWIVISEPTTITAGIKIQKCIVCDEEINREIIPVLALIDIEDVETRAGTIVNVNIDIQNNPGVLGAILTLTYDPSLELIEANAGSAWSSLNLTKPGRYNNYCNFVWDGIDEADTTNGTIITLTFKVPDDANVGDVYFIDLSYTDGNIVNVDNEAIKVEISGGSISVTQLKGDVNDDGVVDLADVVTLRRYIAGGYDVVINELQSDMNEDGQINISDIIELRKYIVNN